MKARLKDNGYGVRVDMGNTGKNWPDVEQPGFPHLARWPEQNAWDAAARWARDMGATEIIFEKESS